LKDILATVDGLLIDIDGVLTLGSEEIPGAPDTIRELRARGIAIRFMTNTTIYCRRSLMERMAAMGFDIREGELFTAAYSAACYLRSQKAKSYYPLLLPDAQLEFTGIPVDRENPEFVVVGDMGASFTFVRMNRAFRALLNGAQLVALHKKRMWRTEEGLFLDGGPFVVALEYAAEVGAVVTGKPSQTYFHMVLEELGIPSSRIAVIGDDIEIDVRGAQMNGLKGWLVKTGRFRKEDLGRGIWPDQTFDSISDLLG
jgi:phospholysine phosphohistidine inorganic pyrophosphate phosphatase